MPWNAAQCSIYTQNKTTNLIYFIKDKQEANYISFELTLKIISDQWRLHGTEATQPLVQPGQLRVHARSENTVTVYSKSRKQDWPQHCWLNKSKKKINSALNVGRNIFEWDAVPRLSLTISLGSSKGPKYITYFSLS